MADEFRIETRTFDIIKVRHLTTGHRFTFRVFEPSLTGRRTLKGTSTERAAKAFEKAARAFAEREAKAAGLID